VGRAFLNFALYIQNIKLVGVNRKGLGHLYRDCFHWDGCDRV